MRMLKLAEIILHAAKRPYNNHHYNRDSGQDREIVITQKFQLCRSNMFEDHTNNVPVKKRNVNVF